MFSLSRLGTRRYLLAGIFVATLQTVIVGYIIESRAAILRHGSDVMLRTAPVDPRDFLRGDYVVLNYDISLVPVHSIVGAIPTDAGERTLWVRVKRQDDGFWGIAESSFEGLPEQADTVVLRSQPFYSYGAQTTDNIHVDYGIERYYVPEGAGMALEQARQDGDVSIAVRVARNGTSQIRSLLVDGKPAYDEPIY
nr:GDYXXLXY domain-containing protein [Rhizobium sp. Root708]